MKGSDNVNFENLNKLPLSIKQEKKWVLYGKNLKTGSCKCPFIYDQSSNKVFALSTNEKYFSINNFYTLNDTIKIYNALNESKISVYNGEIIGIGYYFCDSKYSVIDVDNAFYDGTNNIRKSFNKLINNCINKTYISYSGSKRGLHILVENDMELGKWEFKLKDLKKAYEKANINIDDELKTEGKTPGIDFLCDKKFVALTGNQYNDCNEINYKTSDYKKIYDLFRKFYYKETRSKMKIYKNEYKNYSGSNKIINDKLYVDDYYSYIKSVITLFDVVAKYSDSRLLDGQLHYCPLHSNHNNKSFMLSNKDSNRYICFSSNCMGGKYIDSGVTGDLFDFTKYINNLFDMRQVAEKLNNDFNLGLIFNWEFRKEGHGDKNISDEEMKMKLI